MPAAYNISSVLDSGDSNKNSPTATDFGPKKYQPTTHTSEVVLNGREYNFLVAADFAPEKQDTTTSKKSSFIDSGGCTADFLVAASAPPEKRDPSTRPLAPRTPSPTSRKLKLHNRSLHGPQERLFASGELDSEDAMMAFLTAAGVSLDPDFTASGVCWKSKSARKGLQSPTFSATGHLNATDLSTKSEKATQASPSRASPTLHLDSAEAIDIFLAAAGAVSKPTSSVKVDHSRATWLSNVDKIESTTNSLGAAGVADTDSTPPKCSGVMVPHSPVYGDQDAPMQAPQAKHDQNATQQTLQAQQSWGASAQAPTIAGHEWNVQEHPYISSKQWDRTRCQPERFTCSRMSRFAMHNPAHQAAAPSIRHPPHLQDNITCLATNTDACLTPAKRQDPQVKSAFVRNLAPVVYMTDNACEGREEGKTKQHITHDEVSKVDGKSNTSKNKSVVPAMSNASTFVDGKLKSNSSPSPSRKSILPGAEVHFQSIPHDKAPASPLAPYFGGGPRRPRKEAEDSSIPSLPSTKASCWNSDYKAKTDQVRDIRAEIYQELTTQEVEDNTWARNSWADDTAQPSPIDKFITAWSKDVTTATNIKPRFLQEGVVRHWLHDVDTDTGELLDPIDYPKTMISDKELDKIMDWRRGNWTAELFLRRRDERRQQKALRYEPSALRSLETNSNNGVETSAVAVTAYVWDEPAPNAPKIPCYMRPAQEIDMNAVASIYNWEVINGAQALDSASVSPQDFLAVWKTAQNTKMPFVVMVAKSAEQSDQCDLGNSSRAGKASGAANKEAVAGFGFLSARQPGIAASGVQWASRLGAILNVYVHPDYRRKKIGHSIFDKLMAVASTNYSENLLYDWVDETNDPIYVAASISKREYYKVYLQYQVRTKVPDTGSLIDKCTNEEELEWVEKFLVNSPWWFKRVTRLEYSHRSPPDPSQKTRKTYWMDSVMFEHTCRNSPHFTFDG